VIAEILNRPFVLQEMERVIDHLQNEQPSAENDAVLTSLMAVDLREHARAGEPEPEATSRRRAEAQAAPQDDHAFIARDPIVSLLQSALEQYYEEKAPAEIESTPHADTTVRRGTETVPVAAGRRLRNSTAATRRGRRVLDRFSETDPAWISSVVAMGLRLFRRRHAFKDTAAAPVRLPERSRVLMVGDWGSGIPRALKVSGQMRRVIDEGVRDGIAQHVVHLGDVYYSGFGWEYQKRVLAEGCWPVRPDEAATIGSWSLNGNHDMYAGGHGYYKVLLADPRFARQQQSSFFSLFNDHWKILGLDSAWKDQQLHGSQPAWIAREVEAHRGKIMLLSHHQLFSAYDSPAEAIGAGVEQPLQNGRIDAWFWGHEHRCMTFRPWDKVKHARCIGHGGVPVYMWHDENDPYPEPGVYEYRQYIKKGLERWAMFGFAVLDFDGPKLHVRYVDEDGNEHLKEDL
jgi:hypothetical protein